MSLFDDSSRDRLAEEAMRWDDRDLTPEGWQDSPDAVTCRSVAISLRMPEQMRDVLKEFARREGVGYQVLMKRWLNERIAREAGSGRREDEDV